MPIDQQPYFYLGVFAPHWRPVYLRYDPYDLPSRRLLHVINVLSLPVQMAPDYMLLDMAKYT